MRRAITRADEAMVREKIAKAIGFGDERIGLEWHDGKAIQVRIAPLAGTYREPSQSERRMLAERGIFPGADGWEIEETAPSVARPPLPFDPREWTEPAPGFRWSHYGRAGYGLDSPMGTTIARIEEDVPGQCWRWTIGAPTTAGIVDWPSAPILNEAIERTEDACRKAGMFEPAKPERRPLPAGWKWERRREIQVLLPGEEDRDGCWIAEAHPSGLWKAYRDLEAVAPVAQDTAEPRTIEAAQEAAERVCWARGLFGAPVEPTGTIIGERSAASTALRRLVLRALNRAEDGGMIDPLVYPGAAAHLSDLCDAFVSELRAELAPKPSPSPRTTDGALTAYLLAHYPDEWRTGEDALALAIRLLGETQAIVDSAHEEAERSDNAAKEMAAELAKVRAELNAANSRAAEAEHDRDVAREAARKAKEARDEARTDLAVLRGLCRGFAEKVGVPHG